MNRGPLSVLRDLMPIRPLSQIEALRIAELQADRLLKLAGLTAPPVPEQIITGIPRLDVRRVRPWPVPGTTDWVGSTWVIVLNAADRSPANASAWHTSSNTSSTTVSLTSSTRTCRAGRTAFAPKPSARRSPPVSSCRKCGCAKPGRAGCKTLPLSPATSTSAGRRCKSGLCRPASSRQTPAGPQPSSTGATSATMPPLTSTL